MTTLARLRRLLRPLKACLLAFEKTSELSKSRARPVSKRRRLPDNDDDDDDDSESDDEAQDRHGTRNKRDSLPHTNHKAARSKASLRKKYGSRSASVVSNTSSSNSTATAAALVAKRGPRERLVDAGLDHDLVTKALAVVRSYANVLDAVQLASSGAAPRRSSIATVTTTATVVVVSSLQDICARQIGAQMESFVDRGVRERELEMMQQDRCCASDDEDDEDTEECGCIPGEYCQDCAGFTKRDEQDERALLIDEWYEAIPQHVRLPAMAQHATAVICQELTDPVVAQLCLEACVERNARAESARMWQHVIKLAFVDASRQPGGLRAGGALELLEMASSVDQAWLCARSIETALLESTFEQRWFFSPFLSMSNTTSDTPSIEMRALLFETLLRVADAMIDSLGDDSSQGGQDSDDEHEDDEEQDWIKSIIDHMMHACFPIAADQKSFLLDHVVDVEFIVSFVEKNVGSMLDASCSSRGHDDDVGGSGADLVEAFADALERSSTSTSTNAEGGDKRNDRRTQAKRILWSLDQAMAARDDPRSSARPPSSTSSSLVNVLGRTNNFASLSPSGSCETWSEDSDHREQERRGQQVTTTRKSAKQNLKTGKRAERKVLRERVMIDDYDDSMDDIDMLR